MSFLPTGHDLLISAEILIALFPLRLILDAITSDVRRARRKIIHRHVHQAHNQRLHRCEDADCTTLRAR